MRLSGQVLCCWLYGGFFIISSYLVCVCGNFPPEDEEWLDPFDMLNYDSTSKSMRKPAESSSSNNVPTKRREHSRDLAPLAQCPKTEECTDRVKVLQRELEEHRRKVTFSSQPPTCNPVFKRFLAKLLKEITKLGLPSSVTAERHYDAEVKLSRRMVAEIQKLVNDDNGWRPGALDDALSQILINFKLHDHEAWKWHFEDTFGVELSTVSKVFFTVLIIVLIICTEMWSVVSWFVQFKRMFAICFFISLVWNWFYLYKIAFAEHQANIVKIETVNDKCTGLKKIGWMDNLKEWYRTTWTLQDDPCKQYYEVLFVDPILLVPPTKAITMTITTFITDPMKHIGQGISEFLRALLKEMPITLQIPVLFLIGLSILVFMYSMGQAAIHHAVLRPLRGGCQDPPPGIAQQPAAPPLLEREEHGEEETGRLARGDADRPAQLEQYRGQEHHQINHLGNQGDNRPEIRQRRPNRLRHEQQRVNVETLRHADSGHETDTRQESAAEDQDQHVEEEGNEASASNREIKQPASKKHSAKTDSKATKTSGNTVDGVGNSASRDASKNENSVDVVTPDQETMQYASDL